MRDERIIKIFTEEVGEFEHRTQEDEDGHFEIYTAYSPVDRRLDRLEAMLIYPRDKKFNNAITIVGLLHTGSNFIIGYTADTDGDYEWAHTQVETPTGTKKWSRIPNPNEITIETTGTPHAWQTYFIPGVMPQYLDPELLVARLEQGLTPFEGFFPKKRDIVRISDN